MRRALLLALGALGALGSVELGCMDRGEVLRPVSKNDAGSSQGGEGGDASQPPPPLDVVSELALGQSHTAAIAGERLYTFGDNTTGALGLGDTTERHVPTELAGALHFVSISAGQAYTCGLDEVGHVYCWGANANGQLGQGDRDERLAPARVALPVDVAVRSITADFEHACALLADASLYCWGRNAEGELGQDDATPPKSDETRADALTPIAVPGADWSSVDTGDGSTCGIRFDGSLWCWGRNTDHQLASADTAEQVRHPVRVGSDTDWLRVDQGQQYGCALKQDHSLWCWGLNTGRPDGGFPLGIDSAELSVPTRVGSATDWIAFATRVFHTCAVNRGGELWCWGRNAEGQLGTGDNVLHATPTLVATDIADVALSWFTTCAITRSGRLLCTGKNEHGELGDGTIERPLRFVDVTPTAP